MISFKHIAEVVQNKHIDIVKSSSIV